MKHRKIEENLKELYRYCDYFNNMSPFPIYDTADLKDLKEFINYMENAEKDYDDIPVTACRHCKSLHIITDDVENDICARCGSKNEIVIYTNIVSYLEENKDKI